MSNTGKKKKKSNTDRAMEGVSILPKAARDAFGYFCY